MTVKMTDGGEKTAVVETPTYVVTPASGEQSTSKGIQKKHVLIVVGLVVLSGLIIAGILVGMYIFAEAQKDIVKFSMTFKSSSDGQTVKQDVVSDPNDNSVMYHMIKDGKDIYVVNDFNRDMQVVKTDVGSLTNCYVSALNRSAAIDPSQINDLQNPSDGKNVGGSTVYSVSDSPVSDRSFLPKKALDMCKDVSVYWAYRSCNGQKQDMNNTELSRQSRQVGQAGYYNGLGCVYGCCYIVCSCSVTVVENPPGTCNFYYTTGFCCNSPYNVPQPYCSNVYASKYC